MRSRSERDGWLQRHGLKILLLLFLGVSAQSREIPLEPEAWAPGGAEIVFEEHLGRRAMRVTDGEVTMEGIALRDGVIAFDVAFRNTRGFAGVIFRRPDTRDGENFYLRTHQSGNPDANQYTPVFNGLSAWQIYYGPQYGSPTEYRHDAWMRVRLIVRGDEAEVHLDGEPILHIDDLLREPIEGGIAFWTNIAPAWFSHVTVSDETPPFELEPAAPPVAPPGTIEQWEISEELDWRRIEDASVLDRKWLESLSWRTLSVERNGIANLARVADLRKGNTVLARTVLPADRASKVRFGFSDTVRAFANGSLVYEGNDTYGSRDYRFLGTVGLWDTLFPPSGGEPVELVFAVREGFGGWAVAAAALPAELIPVRYLPGEVSTPEAIEHGAVIASDGRELWFTRAIGIWGEAPTEQKIYVARRLDDGSFGKPAPAPFTGTHLDDDPFPSPDGHWLYFVSDRPAEGKSSDGPDLWRVRRIGSGWGEPEHLASVSSDGYDSSPVVTSDGTLWFSSTRDGGLGSGDLWRARPDETGGFYEPENLGAPVNSPHGEWNLLVSPDGEWLIFEASGRPENVTPSGDLYLSTRGESGWSDPVNLRCLNSPGSDLLPRFGPDGRLLFASTRQLNGRETDVFTVGLDAVRGSGRQPRSGGASPPHPCR